VIGSALSVCAALAFLGVGSGAVAAPRALAQNYGIAVDGADQIAYVRAVGARDAILGLLILAFLARRERGPLAVTLALSAIAGASDFSLVAAARGRSAPLSLAIHGSGTVGLLAIAGFVRAGR
jgi:hypothetical protein